MVLEDDYREKCGEEYSDIYNKWCKPCYLKNDFTNCTSENEEIDGFVQKMQLEINGSEIWKDGPLHYNEDKKEYIRNSDKKVALKYLQNINEVLSEVIDHLGYEISQNPNTKNYIIVLNKDDYCEKCGERYSDFNAKWCKPCRINYLKNDFTNWISGNEEIDDLIQEMQLKIEYACDIVFEWIPYNQFNDIKEIYKIWD